LDDFQAFGRLLRLYTRDKKQMLIRKGLTFFLSSGMLRTM